MAYCLGNRFPPSPKYYVLLDPGAYQYEDKPYKCMKTSENVPFLSNTPRKSQATHKIWTHAIYNAEYPQKIPNITSMMSKRPRFPYEAFSKEDLEVILCKCGIENTCECSIDNTEEQEEVICQAKVRKRIFKGLPPRSNICDGLSTPSKGDQGFNVSCDGSQKRIRNVAVESSPPFYDSAVHESTAFYRGWKWSQWTSKRTQKSLEVRPGPSDYIFENVPTDDKICVEKLKAYRRKTSKQFRFIEMVQQKNISEGRPGPSTYNPKHAKGTDLKFIGPKTKRFPLSKYYGPGPADHYVKRDFEPPEASEKFCHAKLPKPACFGVNAMRFKPHSEEGPSPATYSTNNKLCKYIHCPTAPFNSSAQRFKDRLIEQDTDEEDIIADKNDDEKSCVVPTWGFKSKTVRMKPLIKKQDEASPADYLQSDLNIARSQQQQYNAPFYTSEGRFQPWYNWIHVFGQINTPGPAYYCADNPKCLPAVHRGPLYRAPRFPSQSFVMPAPNQYKVGGGLETILLTHNQRLKKNIKSQHQFHWKEPVEPRVLSFMEQETLLLNKTIALLNVHDELEKKEIEPVTTEEKIKPKLLRRFLFSQQIPFCI